MVESGRISWRRIGRMLLTVFAMIILIGASALGVAYQLDPWWAAGRMHALEPRLDLFPAVLPDSKVASLPGQRVKDFGVSIQLPWAHPDEVKFLHGALLASGNGGTILFEDPLSDPWTAHTIREIAKSIPALSLDDRHSTCSLQRLAATVTTDQVKWWKIPSRNARTSQLLIVKMLTEPMSEGNLYAVNVKGFCGFQRGDPQIAPYRAQIELFDSADRHYRMRIMGHGNSPVFKQAELNALIASIEPALPN